MKNLIFICLLLLSCYDNQEEGTGTSPSIEVFYYNGVMPSSNFVVGDTITAEIVIIDPDLNCETLNVKTTLNSVQIENYNLDIRPQTTSPTKRYIYNTYTTTGTYYVDFTVKDSKGNLSNVYHQFFNLTN